MNLVSEVKNAIAVVEHHKETGSFPTTNPLKEWFEGVRNGKSETPSLKIVCSILDDAIPNWRINQREVTSMENACTVVKYYTSHKKLPSSRDAKNGGTWLANYRRRYRGTTTGTNYASVDKFLDSNIGRGEWLPSDTHETTALENAKKVVAYYHEKGRVPPTTCTEGQWLSHYRKAHRGNTSGKTYDSVDDFLDDKLGGRDMWLPSSYIRESNAMKNAQDVVDYYRKEGSIPTSRNHNCGRWLSNYRQALRGKISAQTYDRVDKFLDENLGGRDAWLHPATKEDFAMENAEKVVKYYRLNNKCPPEKNRENGGWWLNFYRRGHHGIISAPTYDSVDKFLDENIGREVWPFSCPGTKKSIAMEAARQVVDYYRKEGKFPTPSNHKCGRWLSDYRQARRGKISAPTYDSVDKFLDENIDGGRRVWLPSPIGSEELEAVKNAQKVVAHYKTHARFPEWSDVKSGGLWFVHYNMLHSGNRVNGMRTYASVDRYLDEEFGGRDKWLRI